MPDYNAGDAKLRLVPDASQFKAKVEAELAKIKAEFTVRMNVELAQAKADVERFRTQQESHSLKLKTDAGLAGARADMAKFRTEQRANAIDVPAHVDHTGLRGAGVRAGEQFGQEFTQAFASAFKINFLSAGFGLIPGAITAVMGLTQALEQLSTAALVVPGALAGAGASIGTLLIGVTGITEAWKAVEKATEDAGTSSESNLRTAAQAAISYRNAVVDEAQAQKDVATARKDALSQLKDLNLEMRGSSISEREAVLALAEARSDLAKGRFKDTFAAQEAQLRVERAEQRLLETQQRNAELRDKFNTASQQGVENSDAVAAAKEREVRANQQVAQAQQSLNEATNTTTKANEKAAEAFAKLSPQAREVVQTLIDLKPQFIDLRNTVSGNLFEGLSGPIRELVSSLMPNLKTGLGGIATAWNETIKQFSAAAGSQESKGYLDRIFGNTEEAQKRLNAAIQPLMTGLGTLTAAGSDSLPRLSDAIAKVSERFANFITNADKTGKLQEWIDHGLTGMTNLGNAIINVGKTFHNIHEALGGKGLLASLEEWTKKWADWTGSVRGQTALKDFFEEGRRELREWKPIMEDLPGIFKGLFDAARGATYTFLPVLREVTDLLSENPDLVKAIATAFLTWKMIKPMTDMVQAGVGLINSGLINISTGFGTVRSKAVDNMEKTAKAIHDAGGSPFSPLGRMSTNISGLAGLLAGGTGLTLVAASITAIAYLNSLGDAHKTAAERADQQKASEEALVGTLDKYTGKPTPETRQRVMEEMQRWQGQAGQGWMRGDVLAAATTMGLTEEQVTTAAVGGGPVLEDVQKRARAAIKRTIEEPGSAGSGSKQSIWQKLSLTGLSEDTVIDAMLGNEDARKQLGDAVIKYNASGAAEKLKLHDLEKMFVETANRLGPQVAAPILVGQGISYEATAAASAAGQWREQRRGMTKPVQLSDAGRVQFGADAQIFYDGSSAIVITKTPPTDAQRAAVKDTGTRVEQTNLPGEPDEWRWSLSLADMRKYLQVMRSGGTTKAGLALLHDDEFVQRKAAVDKYGVDFMEAVNDLRFPAMQSGGQYPADWFGPTPPPGKGQAGGGWLGALATGAASGLKVAGQFAQQAISQGLRQGQPTGGTAGGPMPGYQEGGTVKVPDEYIAFNPTGRAPGASTNDPIGYLNPDTSPGAPPGPGGAVAQQPQDSAGQAGTADEGNKISGQITLPFIGLQIPYSFPGISGQASQDYDPNSPMARMARVPGLIGLAGALGSGNPQDLNDWISQTLQWTTDFAVNTATKFGTTLTQGALGMVGLENSVLSPTNPWTAAGLQVGQHIGGLANTLAKNKERSGTGTYSVDANGNISLDLTGPHGTSIVSNVPDTPQISTQSDSGAHAGGGATTTAGLGAPGAGRSLLSTGAAAGIARAKALSGQPYVSGTTDCSGYISQVYSAMSGKPTHFTTMADFAALGFKPGYMPGALNIGVIPKPGNSGHMAATLPNGVNIESGGNSGNVLYGSKTGALDPQFPEHWYYLPDMSSGGPHPGIAYPSAASSGAGNMRAITATVNGRRYTLFPSSGGLRTATGGQIGGIKNFAPGGVNLSSSPTRSELEHALVTRGKQLGLTPTEIRMALAVGERESNYGLTGFLGFGPEAKGVGFNYDQNPAGAIEQYYRQYIMRKPPGLDVNNPAVLADYIWHTVHNAADPQYGPRLLKNYEHYANYALKRGGLVRFYDTASWTNPLFIPPGVSVAVNTTGLPEAVVGPPPIGPGDTGKSVPPVPSPTKAEGPAPTTGMPVGPPESKAAGMAAPGEPTPPTKGIGPPPSKAEGMAAPPGEPTPPAKEEGPPAAGPPQAPPGGPEARPAPEQPIEPKAIEEQKAVGPTAAAPTTFAETMHNLPALSTGISSGAQAIGQAVSTAIGIAASAAGSSGFASGAGAAGAIGPYVAGLIQEGGKVVNDAVNVASSFLVGNITGGTTPEAWGRTYMPAQPQPNTSGPNVTNYNGGIVVQDPQELRRELDLRDAQHWQAAIANHRV